MTSSSRLARSLSKTQVMAEEVDWETAYAELLPRVYRYFYFRIGDLQEAEDLTSATFEKAWASRNRYRRDLGGFSNWLFGIARHVSSARLRKARADVCLEEIGVPGSERPTEETADDHGEYSRLAELVTSLNAREREMVSLKYGAELSNREIARLTGWSETNVGTILYRTVGRLRAAWEERA